MRFLAALTILFAATPALSAALETPEQIRACVIANAPAVSNVQAIELRTTDRVGSERLMHAHVYARTDADSFRRVLVRFDRPEELSGSAFLLVERENGNELIVRSPDLPNVTRIVGRQMLKSVMGTDFSYEDFEQLRSLNQPAEPRLLEDASIEGRAAFVLETKPANPEFSAYERVRSYVDKQTCLVTRIELYEAGGKLRKTMTASAERFRNVGSVWVANEIVMRDERDQTETRMLVESFDVDADIPAIMFDVEAFSVAKPDLATPPPVAPPLEVELGAPPTSQTTPDAP
jgi:hypothetical protein